MLPLPHRMQRQLRGMPQLRCIQIDWFVVEEYENADGGEVSKWIAASIEPIRTQLAELKVGALDICMNLGWLLPDTSEELQGLDIYKTVVDDARLSVLLQHLPQLSQLAILEFVLVDSFQHRTCGWQQLSIGYLSVDKLTKLPAMRLQSLKVRVRVQELPCSAEEMLGAAGALSSMAATIHLEKEYHEPVHVYIDSGFPVEDDPEAVAQLLREFSGTGLGLKCFADGILHDKWFEIMSRLSTSDVHMAWQSMPPHCWGKLQRLLPSLRSMTVHDWAHTGDPGWCIAQLTSLCIFASRPLLLSLSWKFVMRLGRTWENAACDGMRAAGHMHVSFALDC